MKRQALLLLLLAANIPALLSQNTPFLARYYPLVNQAEMSIVDANYDQALRYYEEAFGAVPESFARDYHNAALCAIQLGRPETACIFLNAMARQGVTMEHFAKPDFAALHATPAWAIFEAGYAQRHQEHLAGIDGAYCRELSAMAERDQAFRQMDGSYQVYGDTIRSIDSLNIQLWLRLLAAKGFPSVQRIGTCFPAEPVYGIVIHHHAQHLSDGEKYAGWPDLAPALVTAAQNGQLEPAKAAYWLEMQNDPAYRMGAWGAMQMRVDGVLDPQYYIEPPASPGQFDPARAALGLEPFDDYVAKCTFRIYHPDSPFRLSGAAQVNIFELDASLAEIFKKGLMPLNRP